MWGSVPKSGVGMRKVILFASLNIVILVSSAPAATILNATLLAAGEATPSGTEVQPVPVAQNARISGKERPERPAQSAVHLSDETVAGGLVTASLALLLMIIRRKRKANSVTA